jgi:hypothetical protein
MEKELAEHAKDLDGRFYGLTRESLQRLAFKLAARNGIAHSIKNDRAGYNGSRLVTQSLGLELQSLLALLAPLPSVHASKQVL